MQPRTVVFGHARTRRLAQFARTPRNQLEHRLGVIRRGGDRLQHLDAGRLAGDQRAVFGVAVGQRPVGRLKVEVPLPRLGDVGQRADQPGHPPGGVALDRGLIA